VIAPTGPDAQADGRPAGHLVLVGLAASLLRGGFVYVSAVPAAAIFAHELSKREFGLYATIAGITGLATSLTACGLSLAYAASKVRPSRRDQRAAAWAALLLLASVAAVLIGLGAGVAQSADTKLALCAAAVMLLLYAPRVVPLALLTRRIALGRIQAISALEITLFRLAAVGLLAAGFGFAGFVGALLAGAALGTLLAYRSQRAPYGSPTLRPLRPWLARIGPFQGEQTVLAIREQSLPVFVALVAGTAAAGSFGWAYILANLTALMVLPLAPALLAALASQRSDAEQRAAALSTLRLMSAAGLAMLALLAVTLPGLTPLVFGSKWISDVSVVWLLIPGAAVNVLMTVCSPLLQARGEAGRVFRWQAIWLVATLPAGLGFCAIFGVRGLAIVFSLASVGLAARALTAIEHSVSIPAVGTVIRHAAVAFAAAAAGVGVAITVGGLPGAVLAATLTAVMLAGGLLAVDGSALRADLALVRKLWRRG